MEHENERSIRQVLPAQKVKMGEILLDQPLPAPNVDQIDPFLLLHHVDSKIPGGMRQREVGVGPHPHRGFSPVTFVFQGDVQHRDSLGNDATVAAGGTQWMYAGRGITHSERPSQALATTGGNVEFIQLWVNSPAKHKMEQPYYLPLSDADTPRISRAGAEIAVVAGVYEGVTGPAQTWSSQAILRVEGQAGAPISFTLPAEHNTLIYQLDGRLKFQDQITAAKSLIWFNRESGPIKVQCLETTRFLVLSGEPIGEEVSAYGPFVMNTQTEIMEALRDAKLGKMGVLIEDF